MNIDQYKRRTKGMPTEGVRFTKAEEAQARAVALTLEAVDYETLVTIRTALIDEVLYLDSVCDWTIGETEKDRRDSQERALITYRAVDMAIAREKVEGEYV
jgi:hypothetical protein